MGERSSRTSCIGFIPEVHGSDKTVVHSEHVEDFAIRKNIAFKTLHEFVHPDADPASIFLGYCKRFDMAIELTPLTNPIGADLFFSDKPYRPPKLWAS